MSDRSISFVTSFKPRGAVLLHCGLVWSGVQGVGVVTRRARLQDQVGQLLEPLELVTGAFVRELVGTSAVAWYFQLNVADLQTVCIDAEIGPSCNAIDTTPVRYTMVFPATLPAATRSVPTSSFSWSSGFAENAGFIWPTLGVSRRLSWPPRRGQGSPRGVLDWWLLRRGRADEIGPRFVRQDLCPGSGLRSGTSPAGSVATLPGVIGWMSLSWLVVQIGGQVAQS